MSPGALVRRGLVALGLGLVLVAAAAWIAGGLLLTGGKPSPAGMAAAAGGSIQEVRFTAGDGVALRGWWLPGRDTERAVVLLHGWKADRLQMLPRAKWLHHLGYSVLLFDFRGCGESGGRSGLGYDERLDVEAALRFLREEKKVRQTALLGESLGAAAAVMAVDRWEGVRGAVLELLYDRLEHAVRARIRNEVGMLEPAVSPLFLWQVRPRLGFNPAALAPVERIGRAPCSLLLGFGGRDPYIQATEAGALFGAAPPPASLWVVQRAEHTDLYRFDPQSYQEQIGEFLGKTLGPPDKGCKG